MRIVLASVSEVSAEAIGPSHLRRSGGSIALKPASISSRWKRSSDARSVVATGGEAARLLAPASSDGSSGQLLPLLVTTRRNLEDRAEVVDLADDLPPDDRGRALVERERVL